MHTERISVALLVASSSTNQKHLFVFKIDFSLFSCDNNILEIDANSWTSFDGSQESVSSLGKSIKPATLGVDWDSPTWLNDTSNTDTRQQRKSKQNLLIVNELIDTEKDYVADMEFVTQNYITPLSKLLNVREQRIIFMNWQQLTKMHKNLLKNLSGDSDQVKSDTEALDKTIRYLIEFLKLAPRPYMIFCCNQLEACRILQVKLDSDIRFKQLMRDCDRHNDNKNRLPYTTYLLKPMQRITRYSLFLEKILTESKTNNMGDYRLINEAHQLAQKLCHQVNEACKLRQDNQENRRNLEWCQAHIKLTSSTSSHSPLIGIPSPTLLGGSSDRYLDEAIIFDSLTNCSGKRKFIKAGTLIKSRSGKELMAFLFNDFLLLTVPTVFLPKVANLFDNKRALQAYYKIYRRPLMLDRLAIISDISDDAFRASTSIDLMNPYNEFNPVSTTNQLHDNTQQQLMENSKDTSFRLDDGADGKVYSLKCLDTNEKKSWLKELKIASERMIENKLKLRSYEPIIRKPDPSQCSGRLFVTLVEAKNLKHQSRSSLHLYATISLICYEGDSDYSNGLQDFREIFDRQYMNLSANTSSSTVNIVNNNSESSSTDGSSLSSIPNINTSINNTDNRYERMSSIDMNRSNLRKSHALYGNAIKQVSDRYRTRTINSSATNLPVTSNTQTTLPRSNDTNRNSVRSLISNQTQPSTSTIMTPRYGDSSNNFYSFDVVWNDSTQFLLEDVSLSSKDVLLLTINEENPFCPVTQIAECVLPISEVLSNIGSAVGPVEKDFPLNNVEYPFSQRNNEPSISLANIAPTRKEPLQLSRSLSLFPENTRTDQRERFRRATSFNRHKDNSLIRLKFDVQIFNI